MLYDKTTCEPEEKDIPVQMKRLDNTIEELDKVLSVLEDSLQLICRNSTNEVIMKEERVAEDHHIAPLAHSIREHCERVDSLKTRVVLLQQNIQL